MRTWLYHRTHGGRIYDTAAMLPGEMDQLTAEGWRDCPAKAEAVTDAPAGDSSDAKALTPAQARARKKHIAARLRELGAEVPDARSGLATFETRLAAAEEAA